MTQQFISDECGFYCVWRMTEETSCSGNLQPLQGNLQLLQGNLQPLQGNLQPLQGDLGDMVRHVTVAESTKCDTRGWIL